MSSLREAMPWVAAIVDDLRDHFGRAAVDEVIRRGIAGEADHFHAREAHHQVGTPWTWPPGIGADRIQLDKPEPAPKPGTTVPKRGTPQ